MHRIRINEGIDHKIILLSYYYSISLAFTEIEVILDEIERAILVEILGMRLEEVQ